MKVECVDLAKVLIYFEPNEVEFLKREAKDNKLMVEEMLSMIMDMLFIEGYSDIIGK